MTIYIFALSNKVLTRLIEFFNKYLSCSKQKYFVTSYIYCHKTLIFFVFLACFDYFLFILLPKVVENFNMSISLVGTSFQGFDDLWGAKFYGFSFRFIYFTIPVILKGIFILRMIISICNQGVIDTSQILHTHYFIRKRLRVRQNNKKIRFHKWFIFLVLGGITNQNEKTVYRNMEQNMPNRFIQTEYNNINVQFHSIWYISAKKSTFNVTSSYLWMLLLLGGDIELNPGPDSQFNYTLNHPNLCGFYRTALYFVFKCIKLVSRKDDKGIEIYEEVSPNESIKDVKAIFNNYFNMSVLDFVKFEEHKDRFLSNIVKWGKNRGREDRKLYLNTFSVVNWLGLNESTKLKHSVLCNECEVTHLNVHAKFPSNSPMYSTEKEKLSSLVENSNSD